MAVANKGVIPSSFYPTQYCLNSYSDNSRFPLAVVEGDVIELKNYVYECCACMYVHHMQALFPGRQKRMVDILKLDLEMGGSCPVGSL